MNKHKALLALGAGVFSGLLLVAVIGTFKSTPKEVNENITTASLVKEQDKSKLTKAQKKEQKELDKFLKWG